VKTPGGAVAVEIEVMSEGLELMDLIRENPAPKSIENLDVT